MNIVIIWKIKVGIIGKVNSWLINEDIFWSCDLVGVSMFFLFIVIKVHDI